MTGGKSSADIQSLNFADLPDLIPEPRQFHRTHQYDEMHWQRIPLLQDVLDALPPHIALIIEFKMCSPVLIAEVNRMVDECGRAHSVFWFSLKDSINNQLKRFNPNLPTITSQVTLADIEKDVALKFLPQWCKVLLSYLFAGTPPRFMMSPSLFAHLRRRGVPVLFLGVNTEGHIALAHNSGATAVLTDRVEWLYNHMKDNKIELMKIE
ncbi:unnamed protein product [Symbiodinium microadriaticum]|nr:unnamed protein product [Symbiodinium microadriaticum]